MFKFSKFTDHDIDQSLGSMIKKRCISLLLALSFGGHDETSFAETETIPVLIGAYFEWYILNSNILSRLYTMFSFVLWFSYNEKMINLEMSAVTQLAVVMIPCMNSETIHLDLDSGGR